MTDLDRLAVLVEDMASEQYARAEKLTEDEQRVLAFCPFIGPRPGSNQWVFVELEGVHGEVIDGMIRRGLLVGTIARDPRVLVPQYDDLAECDIDLSHDYDLTPAGRAALKGRWP